MKNTAVTLALSGLLAFTAVGCAVTRDQSTVGEYVDDTTVTTRVKAKLAELGIDIPDAEVIRWLTSNPAKAMGIEAQTGSLEAGNVWDRRNDVDFGSLVVGGSLFTGFDTPLGPIFLGYGRNQAGADSWYLSFGSLLRQDPR